MRDRSSLDLVLFLCYLLCQIKGSDCRCTTDENCHGIEAQGKMISTVCNQSTAEISFSDDSSERRPTFQALEFVCSYLNYTVEIDLLCNRSTYLRGYGTTKSFELPVNLSYEHVVHGSHCFVRGCYTGDEQIKFNISSNSCTIQRDCIWTEWSDWTICDKECGGGLRTRRRTVQVEAGWNGNECTGQSVENVTCNEQDCPVHECSVSSPCHENANCTNTAQGFNCTCNVGFVGNGTYCVDLNECKGNSPPCEEHTTCVTTPGGFMCTCNGSCLAQDWIIATAVSVAAVFITTCIVAVVLVGIWYRIVARKNQGLNHKHLEKFLGKFDPDFDLPISTNLKEISTTSNVSVFDSLWADSLPVERDYVTLGDLGINIQDAKNSDSEVSIELRVTCSEGNSDNEEECVTNVRHVTDGYVSANESLPVQNLDSSSNFSLNLEAIQELFQNGQDLQKTEKLSGESESENRSMSEGDLDYDLDFHDGTVQITSPPPTFTGQENKEYIRVDDVCFKYPPSETIIDPPWDELLSPSFNTTPSQHVTAHAVPVPIQSPFFPLQTNTEQTTHSSLHVDNDYEDAQSPD